MCVFLVRYNQAEKRIKEHDGTSRRLAEATNKETETLKNEIKTQKDELEIRATSLEIAFSKSDNIVEVCGKMHILVIFLSQDRQDLTFHNNNRI